jgi:ABC-2 type transport system permease protein/oleandomycin transport system permease protein
MAETTFNSTPKPQARSNNDGVGEMLYWNLHDTIVIARRNLVYYRRQPQLLVFSTIQPVMFLLLFTFVFGGAISSSSSEYIQRLLPGILVQTAMFGGIGTSIGLAEDLAKGLIDRFRSLPMARSSVLAGRTLADSVRNVFVVSLLILVGYIIGFRFQNGAINALLAIGLVLLFGHAMQWVYALIGLMVKDAETAQSAGFIWVFPLVFASSIFAPTQTMPEGLRYFAEHQPVTLVAEVVRDLMIGTNDGQPALALAWIVGIWVVFGMLAIRQYRVRSA